MMSWTGVEVTYPFRNPHEFFEHCRDQRFTHPFRPLSQTCDRCGISYYAHFDHPQRCPAWTTDEVDRQAAQEPAPSPTSSGP
jgi:hypothetical protein